MRHFLEFKIWSHNCSHTYSKKDLSLWGTVKIINPTQILTATQEQNTSWTCPTRHTLLAPQELWDPSPAPFHHPPQTASAILPSHSHLEVCFVIPWLPVPKMSFSLERYWNSPKIISIPHSQQCLEKCAKIFIQGPLSIPNRSSVCPRPCPTGNAIQSH